MHSNYGNDWLRPLRACTLADCPYVWIHPGDDFDGHVHSGRLWFEMPCWLSKDLNYFFQKWRINRWVKTHLLAEIDVLLEEASYGELEQETHGFVKTTPKQVEWTRAEPLVAELRLPEPFYVNERRCRCRVFHYEPGDYPNWLVSLGALIKDVDDPQSRQAQTDVIRQCGERRRVYEARRG